MATVALLPAGRGEVFAQMFSVSEGGVVTEIDAAAHLLPRDCLSDTHAFREMTWAGNGAEQQRQRWKILRSREPDLAQGIKFRSSNLDLRSRSEISNSDLSSQAAEYNGDSPRRKLISRGMSRSWRYRLLRPAGCNRPMLSAAIYVRPSDAELKELPRN